jgi:Flp pilus assembly pilin Flp
MLTQLRTSILMLLKSSSGAAGVEYGLLVSLIAIAIILSVGFMGETMTQSYEKFGVAMGEESDEESNNPSNPGSDNPGNSGGNNPGNSGGNNPGNSGGNNPGNSGGSNPGNSGGNNPGNSGGNNPGNSDVNSEYPEDGNSDNSEEENPGNSGRSNPGNPHGFDGDYNPGKGAPTPGGGREKNQEIIDNI